MRYIIVFFWALILGNVAGYIGGALNSGSYDFTQTSLIVLVSTVIILLMGQVAQPKKSAKTNK